MGFGPWVKAGQGSQIESTCRLWSRSHRGGWCKWAMALDEYPVNLPRTPKLQHFAMLAGLEAAVRGVLISVMPLVVRDAMGSTQDASAVYFDGCIPLAA